MNATPFVHRYQIISQTCPAPATAVDRCAFAILDSETTGLDVERDVLISIGAVRVRGGEIDVGDSFSVLLPISYNSQTVVFHGITRQESLTGLPEPEALAGFLDFVGNSVLVGHHLGHDLKMINKALRRVYGLELVNPTIDTATLAAGLAGRGLFANWTLNGNPSLDNLCSFFQIPPHDRHTCLGDAFLTAQIFLRLLSRARKSSLNSLESLQALAD